MSRCSRYTKDELIWSYFRQVTNLRGRLESMPLPPHCYASSDLVWRVRVCISRVLLLIQPHQKQGSLERVVSNALSAHRLRTPRLDAP